MKLVLVFNYEDGKLHVFEYNEEEYVKWRLERKDKKDDLFEFITEWYSLEFSESSIYWMEVEKFAPIFHEFYES